MRNTERAILILFGPALVIFQVYSSTLSCVQSPDTERKSCECSFSSNGSVFSLYNPNGSPTYSAKKDKAVYLYSPCSPMSATPNPACADSYMCQQSESWYSLGKDPVSFPVAGDQLFLNYSKASTGKYTRSSLVKVVCDRQAKEATLVYVGQSNVLVGTTTIYYNFTLTGPQACLSSPGPATPTPTPTPPSGLSVGSVLCIILLVVVVLYVIVGILVMKFARGATGAELCPNFEFWKDLPFLVKDGCVLTFTGIKTGCKCHKGSYDQM